LSTTRVALVGGSEALRRAKRSALEAIKSIQVIFDSDGFGLLPQDLLELNFDVAIIEHRLSNQTGVDFVSAIHSLARVSSTELGSFLVGAQFSERELRVLAIRSGAVDCVFVSDGLESFVEKVLSAANPLTDFAIRELLPELGSMAISQEDFQSGSVGLNTLDIEEAKILKGYAQLKSDSAIASYASVPVAKVRATLIKIQYLLLLDTRSQLLLRLYEMGALAL